MSMKEYDLTDFEERLFIAAGTTEKIRRFKRSSTVSTILFSGIFAALALLVHLNWIIAVVLGIYAVINLMEVRRFAMVITSYRSLAAKIKKSDADDDRVEQALRKNSLLLAVFYIVLLAVLFLLCPAYASAGTGVATVTLLWLFLRLKLAAANTIIAYKNEIVEAGKANEMRRNSAHV